MHGKSSCNASAHTLEMHVVAANLLDVGGALLQMAKASWSWAYVWTGSPQCDSVLPWGVSLSHQVFVASHTCHCWTHLCRWVQNGQVLAGAVRREFCRAAGTGGCMALTAPSPSPGSLCGAVCSFACQTLWSNCDDANGSLWSCVPRFSHRPGHRGVSFLSTRHCSGVSQKYFLCPPCWAWRACVALS